MRIRYLTIMTAALALAGGCGHKQPERRPEGPAVRVQTMEIQLQKTPEVQEVVGTVRPKLSAAVSPKVMAVIREITVKLGDAVTAGQVLARLDDREMQATFERAKADYERFKTLLEKQAVTRAEFDTAQAQFRIAEAALSYAVITAPFDGFIAQKPCEIGDLAAPGKPLFVIEKPGEFRLEASVPERFAGMLAVGKGMEVFLEATDETCAGQIGEIVPTADVASRSILVKIDLPCTKPLKSGMFGRARLQTGERTGLMVPKPVVHERGQLTYVFVAADHHAQMRLVKLGKEYPQAFEIVAGLQPGERVITSAAADLTDGQPVELQ